MKSAMFYATIASVIFCGCSAVGSHNFAYNPPTKQLFIENNTSIIDNSISIGKFKSDYFSIWDKADIEDAKEALKFFRQMPFDGQWYRENMHPYSAEELNKILDEATLNLDVSKPKNAIALKNTDLRCMPSKKPFFRDFNKAGEGYPFDYAQNSRIYIGMPLKILDFSVSKEYCFVKSGAGYGFVDSRDVALVDKKTEAEFKDSDLASISIDKVNSLDIESGRFVERLNIGTLLPKKGKYVYYPKLKDDGYAYLSPLAVMYGATAPMPISQSNISALAQTILGEPYGWGGMLDNRDCSMLLRDIFINFGIVLPRNSADQALGYKDVSKLNYHEKIQYIKTNAKPWRSVFYMKGHIMLYVGIDNKSGEILAMHDAWGIKSFDKSGNEGRAILGGVVITTLEEGSAEDWYDKEKSPYIKKIIGIKDLF